MKIEPPLPEPESHFKYVAIDCNHRLHAFKRLKIPTARAHIFPQLPEEVYCLVAGKNSLFFIYFFIRGC